MKKYLGVKLISAELSRSNCSCDRAEGDARECKCQKDGYKVVYEDGYTSWSPKDVFEKAYREIKTLDVNLKELLPHQERVQQEAKELNDKIQKLDSFIVERIELFCSLPKDEQTRLEQQLLAMKYYLSILVERMENF